ncbi:hypothetical protein ACFFIO_03745 [Citricoccus parietis]|uniref:NodB homology domain-containing protein n=1 Tax=Citricoccus parietis TaxID=592307 RepID=A0ABV6F2H7_9MICC
MSTNVRSPYSQKIRTVLLVLATVLALLTTGLVTFSLAEGAQSDSMARYPGSGAQSVPRSTEILLQLSPGWADAADDLSIQVTGSDGSPVPGHTAVNSSGILSFVPEDQLDAGRTTVEVLHHTATGDGEDQTLDSWQFTVNQARDLTEGAGGSLLLIARDGTADSYLAEILRAEGFMSFDTVAPDEVTADLLAHHAVVVVGAGSASGSHVEALETWVAKGGDLVTLRPEGQLATLGGLTPAGGAVQDGYLTIDTSSSVGAGLTGESMQFHGAAGIYETNAAAGEGAADGHSPETAVVAVLSSAVDDPTVHPAVTWNDVGTSGGHVVTFTYDLATSVLLTRQGNPAWAGQERDGSAPIRPNDLFTGGADEDDYLDLSRIGVPQADEQMRLLGNTLVMLHDDTGPLPRFWYLPHGKNAAIVMTADDHGTDDGTRESFERMLGLDAPGCEVRLWECHRATSWFYPESPLTDSQAASYQEQGFDLGVHATTDCADWTPESLNAAFQTSLMEFRDKYSSLRDQRGHRLHCIANSQWLEQASIGLRWGIRFDMNYYNWPPGWIQDRAGYMTGSALPMRFSDVDGRIINVFQQESHLVNETWNGSSAAIEQLIDAAEDERGYYGAFGTHYDFSDAFDRQLMEIAAERDIPMVSAQQLLDFTEGRNASSFANVSYTDPGAAASGADEDTLEMTWEIDVDDRASDLLQAMVPLRSGDRLLASISKDGTPLDFHVRQIKGITYAFFPAANGSFEARYR